MSFLIGIYFRFGFVERVVSVDNSIDFRLLVLIGVDVCFYAVSE